MAKLTGDIIKAGLHVWVKGWDRQLNDIPVEVVIDTGIVQESNTLEVTRVADESSPACISRHPDTGKYVIYLGDSGVRPYNYNNRATQVFTTKEELVTAMEVWKAHHASGGNPNFVTEEGDSIKCYMHYMDADDYDYYEED